MGSVVSHGWRKSVFVKGRARLSHSWESWMSMEWWFLENTKINSTFSKSANVNLNCRWFKNVNTKQNYMYETLICKYAYVKHGCIVAIWFCKCIDMRFRNYYLIHWNPVRAYGCSYELWMIFRSLAWIWLRKPLYWAVCKR